MCACFFFFFIKNQQDSQIFRTGACSVILLLIMATKLLFLFLPFFEQFFFLLLVFVIVCNIFSSSLIFFANTFSTEGSRSFWETQYFFYFFSYVCVSLGLAFSFVVICSLFLLYVFFARMIFFCFSLDLIFFVYILRNMSANFFSSIFWFFFLRETVSKWVSVISLNFFYSRIAAVDRKWLETLLIARLH